MKNLLLITGGVILGYYLATSKSPFAESFRNLGKKAAVKHPETTVRPHTDVADSNPMVRDFDATPAATFSPPRTEVIVPATEVTDVLNIDQAGTLVQQPRFQ